MATYRPHEQLEPFDFGGLEIRDFGPGEAGSASVALVRVPAGGSHPRARSARSEKYYLGLEGVLRFDIGGGPVQVRAGDLLVIPPMDWFSYRNDGAMPAAVALVHVPPFRLDDEEFAE